MVNGGPATVLGLHGQCVCLVGNVVMHMTSCWQVFCAKGGISISIISVLGWQAPAARARHAGPSQPEHQPPQHTSAQLHGVQPHSILLSWVSHCCLRCCCADAILQACATCAMLPCASSSSGTPRETCSSAQHRAPRQSPTSGGESLVLLSCGTNSHVVLPMALPARMRCCLQLPAVKVHVLLWPSVLPASQTVVRCCQWRNGCCMHRTAPTQLCEGFTWLLLSCRCPLQVGVHTGGCPQALHFCPGGGSPSSCVRVLQCVPGCGGWVGVWTAAAVVGAPRHVNLRR